MEVRRRPIHDGDLAAICVDSLEGKSGDVDAGGPEALTRQQIGELAFAAAGKRPRFLPTPRWWIRTVVRVMKPFHPRMADLAVIMDRDLVAPVKGERRLSDYFDEGSSSSCRKLTTAVWEYFTSRSRLSQVHGVTERGRMSWDWLKAVAQVDCGSGSKDLHAKASHGPNGIGDLAQGAQG